MLWLLAAELRKLIRPLVWGTGLVIIGFCLLITWGGANNARGALASPGFPMSARGQRPRSAGRLSRTRTPRPGLPHRRRACSPSPAR